jgi:hypothetical protein
MVRLMLRTKLEGDESFARYHELNFRMVYPEPGSMARLDKTHTRTLAGRLRLPNLSHPCMFVEGDAASPSDDEAAFSKGGGQLSATMSEKLPFPNLATGSCLT